MLKNIIKKEEGFTLLELLIVIVIIGILALLIIPNITSAPKKANDTKRKTDITAIQKALEDYYVSNNVYPATTAALSTGTTPYMKTVPNDPKNSGTLVYTYTSASPFSTYTLTACLENSNATGDNVTTVAAGTCASTKQFSVTAAN